MARLVDHDGQEGGDEESDARVDRLPRPESLAVGHPGAVADEHLCDFDAESGLRRGNRAGRLDGQEPEDVKNGADELHVGDLGAAKPGKYKRGSISTDEPGEILRRHSNRAPTLPPNRVRFPLTGSRRCL